MKFDTAYVVSFPNTQSSTVPNPGTVVFSGVFSQLSNGLCSSQLGQMKLAET
jgi:hypothetical protein